MSVEETKCCNMHTKEKEEDGTCCQIKDDEEQMKEQNEQIISSARTVICLERLLSRQKMYLYSRWNENFILYMVLR